MSEQHTFMRDVALSQVFIWVCAGGVAGMVPIIGPLVLGTIVMQVHSLARVPHSLWQWMVAAALSQYGIGYLMSENAKVALVQLLVFLLACAGTRSYEWWSKKKSVHK